MLALEWKGYGTRSPDYPAPKVVATEGQPDPAVADVYIFRRAEGRDAILEDLLVYSAQDNGGAHIPVFVDTVFRDQVLKEAGEDPVLAATVTALGPTEGGGTGLFRQAATKADPNPRLFVLTTKQVIEFDIHPLNWGPVQDLEHAILLDDFTPEEMLAEEEEEEEASKEVEEEAPEPLPPPDEDEMARRRMERLRGQIGESHISKNLMAPSASGPVLSFKVKHSMPPSEVHFESRNEADLTLHFSSGAICLRFYSDSSREFWRKALAYALTRNDGNWARAF